MNFVLPGAGLNFSATVASAAADPALGDLPIWKLQDLYPSATSTAFTSDMEKAGRNALAFEEKWKGKLADAAAKKGAGGIGDGAEGIRGAGRSHRPSRLFCRPHLFLRYDQPGKRQALRRRPGEDHRILRPPSLLRAGAEPHRRRGDGRMHGKRPRGRPLPPLADRPAQGQALPAGRQAGTALSRKVDDECGCVQPPLRRDHGRAPLRYRRRESAARSRAQSCCRTRIRKRAARRQWRSPKPSRRISAPSR